MTGQRVLVLRPEPGATETAARLREAGYVPVVMPLSEIRPLVQVFDVDLTGIGGVAATSVNAVRHAPEAVLAPLRHKPLFAVGEATANAARGAGFEQVTAGDDDGAALAQIILRDQPDGALLYLCGKVRRPEFERVLRENGVTVVPVEIYDAVPVDQLQAFGEIIKDVTPLVVMCHSPEASRLLADLIQSHAGVSGQLRAVAISERAAAPLIAQSVTVRVAKSPTDQAMLAALG